MSSYDCERRTEEERKRLKVNKGNNKLLIVVFFMLVGLGVVIYVDREKQKSRTPIELKHSVIDEEKKYFDDLLIRDE